MASQTGLKFDDGKLRWDLVPWDTVEEVVKVITMGAAKYAENNWEQLDKWNDRYFAAAMRHLIAYRLGEYTDDESGLPHLAHAVTNLLFMLHISSEKTIQDQTKPTVGSIEIISNEDRLMLARSKTPSAHFKGQF